MTTRRVTLAVLFLLQLYTFRWVWAQDRERPATRQEMLRGTITPEREWWDVLHYDLSVQFMPETRTIKGSTSAGLP